MAGTPSPFVFWAQTQEKITLKVDLKDVKEPEVAIEKKSLEFRARGRGARGLLDYEFRLSLHGIVIADECNHQVHDSHVLVTLRKAEPGYWTKLISQPLKLAWLKVDFDRWTSEHASLSDDENVGDVREDFPQIYNQLQKDERGYKSESWKKVYLVLYNLCQAVLFLTILMVMSLRYAKDGPDSIPTTYENVGNIMKFCTLLQILEILHPIFGYTRNSAFLAFLQIFGRLLALLLCIDSEPRMQTKPVVFYLFVAWSSIEVVRYPFYIAQLNGINIYFLTWLRYSLWIILYPIGFTCEGIIYIRSIPYFEETKKFGIELPNAWNVAFNIPSVIRVGLLFAFFPGCWMLMTQMYRERCKRLGTKPKHS